MVRLSGKFETGSKRMAAPQEDLHDILGVDRGATEVQVERAAAVSGHTLS